MGMFDYVKYEAPCGICGLLLTEWQTKDGECVMETITAENIVYGSFYTFCPKCSTWNEFHVRPTGPSEIIRALPAPSA